MVGKQVLCGILDEYVERHHPERNHQGVGNRLLFGEGRLSAAGQMACGERLGGLLRFYYREGA